MALFLLEGFVARRKFARLMISRSVMLVDY